MTREIIITGGDSNFFGFMYAALSSLRVHKAAVKRDFGIIDQGLLPEQKTQLRALGCKIIEPTWTLPVPAEARSLRNIGLVARTALRDYFPGYDVYLWFDADAWVQTPEFIEAFIQGARKHGAAVVTENGAGYRKTWSDRKWWGANMVANFGVRAGVKCLFQPSINIGVLALKDTAPHWDAWTRLYAHALEHCGKVNQDQHAFFAAIHLYRLPTAFLPARFNWLPHLSCPVWDESKRVLCEPIAPYRPLSVIHLAGPRKDRPYTLPALNGNALQTPLTYPAMQPHLLGV
jgi:lipopolysaccharide biosynthesis glycosyltransferase